MKRAALLLLRVLLGGVFVVAGASKIGDPAGFARAIANYELFPALAPLLAVTLPPVEIAAGALLLLAPLAWRRAAALCLAALMVVFTAAAAAALARGIDVACGCFGGEAGGSIDALTIARDLALLGAAAVLLLERAPAPTPPAAA